MDNSDLVDVAKAAIAGHSPCSRQFFDRAIDRLSEEHRQVGLSHTQNVSRFLDTPTGQLLYKASRASPFATDGAGDIIAKALHDHTHDGAIRRINKMVLAVVEANPGVSEADARREVLAKDARDGGYLYAEACREAGVTVAKSDANSATRRLVNAAQGLVRQKVVASHDEAMLRTQRANPRLHAAALAEIDADDEVGGGMVKNQQGGDRQ